jgi:UDP-N-acetylmuramate--alanine ligase
MANNIGGNVTTLPAIVIDVYLPMMGRHNVQNALAVVAVAQELGVADAVLRHAFKTFKGVKRRFTQVGNVNGVLIIDDYAHHPAEIQAAIASAKQAVKGKIYAVVQPHRYSRLKDLFEDFSNCFEGCYQILVSPVYSAGEAPNGVTGKDLANSIASTGLTVRYFENPSELPGLLMPLLQPDDMIICMGAGSITAWAYELAHTLEENFNPLLKTSKKVSNGSC